MACNLGLLTAVVLGQLGIALWTTSTSLEEVHQGVASGQRALADVVDQTASELATGLRESTQQALLKKGRSLGAILSSQCEESILEIGRAHV